MDIPKKATEANRKYLALGAPAETKAPNKLQLTSYGKSGRVIIQVVGAFGKIPSDMYAIIDLVASTLKHKHLSYYSKRPSRHQGHASADHPHYILASQLTWDGLGF